MTEIRNATLADLDAVTEIYNDAILNTTATFDTTPKTRVEQEAWFEKHGVQHPVFVAVEAGIVVGWASLSAWSDRCAYAGTAEVSLYVKDGCRGRGIGKKLFERLDRAASEVGLHTLVSRIADESKASIHLHELFGFRHIGVMKEVGLKFGRLLDVYLMQKVY
jgi:phosphinothricin acetyltransferase